MSDRFINPYTFIPVGEGRKRAYDSYYSGEKLISGKISCTLTARTQLAVNDTNGAAEQTAPQEFFSLDGVHPMIPGSSLRGCIRSIYEALTDSCLPVVNAEEDDYFTSRMMKSATAVLQKTGTAGEYALCPATQFSVSKAQLGSHKTGDCVKFTGTSVRAKNRTINKVSAVDRGTDSGYVLIEDDFDNGKCKSPEHCYIVKKTGVAIKLYEKHIERLCRNISDELYITKDPTVAVNYRAAFEKMLAGECSLPVWFSDVSGTSHTKPDSLIYLAPSQISRSVFMKRPIDLITEKNLQKCSFSFDESNNKFRNVCEACALFGIVSGINDGMTISSRVRFSDAVCSDKNAFDGTYILPILAQPKLSSFEFYLKNSEEKTFGADDSGTEIAGRKYYWHNNKCHINKDTDKVNENMSSKVQLVKTGTKFSFVLFFDRITERQLKMLLFTLNLGENSEKSNHLHKIGCGKPIGLGSVKIVADKVTVRSFNGSTYSETDRSDLANNPDMSVFTSQDNVANILKVTDFNAVKGELISYPAMEEGGDIFDWFTDNRPLDTKYRDKPQKFITTLPLLTDENQSLTRKPNSRK